MDRSVITRLIYTVKAWIFAFIAGGNLVSITLVPYVFVLLEETANSTLKGLRPGFEARIFLLVLVSKQVKFGIMEI